MKAYRDVDSYLAESELWPDEIEALRPILLGCGLTEEIKWGKPCYSHAGKNVMIVQEFKDFLALMFFKGALLDDPAGVLESQGENTRSARRMTFTSVDEVTRMSALVADYVAEAIDVEEQGLSVEPAPELELVTELRDRFRSDPALQKAFESLTPGRQREYNLYFAGAKQSETRRDRIDRHADRILQGKGMRER